MVADRQSKFLCAMVSLALAGVAGCKTVTLTTDALPSGGAPLRIVPVTKAAAPERWDVALLADPQLHNFLGGKLKSMSPVATRVTSVARRPAVLNVLGQLVLDAFIAELARSRAPLMLVLGDVANVGCTGEFDRFAESMKSQGAGIGWLAVHGNHDSFLAGNFSAYQRGEARGKRVGVAAQESRWTADEARGWAYSATNDRHTSWPQACAEPARDPAEPARDSVPMTKGMWLRRYLMALEDQGVRLRLDPGDEAISAGGDDTPFNIARCAAPFQFKASADASTRLGAHGFLLSGVWRPRDRIDVRRKSGKGYQESWEERCPGTTFRYEEKDTHEWGAFVVQSVDIGATTTALLVDTSIRESFVGGRDFSEYPGRFGRLGDAQIDVVFEHRVRASQRKRAVVLVGHHPWAKLPEDERERLWREDEKMGVRSPILYISGHTHLESSMIVHGELGTGFPELNVGSVIDWPMESALLAVTPQQVLWRIIGLHGPKEGGQGCKGAGQARSYQQIPLADMECDEKVDRRDLTNLRLKWREHQVPRTEQALRFLARGGVGEPATATYAGGGDRSEATANWLRSVADANIRVARDDAEVRALGLSYARCASRAVLSARVNHAGTCPRRDEPTSVTAASVYGFAYAPDPPSKR